MTSTVSRPWMEMSLARQNSMAAIFSVGGKEGQTQKGGMGASLGKEQGHTEPRMTLNFTFLPHLSPECKDYMQTPPCLILCGAED